MRQRISELRIDIPAETANAFTMLRAAPTAALLTLIAMFIAPTAHFWTITIGGWLVTGAIAIVGTVKLHAHFAKMAIEDARMYAEADWEATTPVDQEDDEEFEQEVDNPMVRLGEMGKTNIIYGVTKPIPHVFDVPAGFPAGIAHNDSDRFRHSYIIGKTGSGKSVFLRNVILQDIKKGRGVILLSHERVMFEEYIMPYYPSERIDDLIYFDPADNKGKVIGFNIFEINAGEDPAFKAGEIYTVFERTVDDLGASMKPILLKRCTRSLSKPQS
jgi:hypothetical protein